MTYSIYPIKFVALVTISQLQFFHDLQLSFLMKLACFNQSYDALIAKTISCQFFSTLDFADLVLHDFVLINLHYPCNGNLSQKHLNR